MLFDWATPEVRFVVENTLPRKGQTFEEREKEINDYIRQITKDDSYADRMWSYRKNPWLSFSTPIHSNFGTDKGLPISCFGTFVEDSIESMGECITEHMAEGKRGGGTSANYSAVRPKGSPISSGGVANGPTFYIRFNDTVMDIVSQGNSRRGNCAVYLSVDHQDIFDFLAIRSDGHFIQNLSFGVTIPEGWMQAMVDGDKKKRKIWAKILEIRSKIGYPYIVFLDNAKEGAPNVYKLSSFYNIGQSNLCTEIMLPNNKDESFVCCLASLNVLYYDEWKNTKIVEDSIRFLDLVISDFIEKASKIKYMERPVEFARNHRALGLGQMGWHSYLQSKMIPYESWEAKRLNVEIAKIIKERAYKESEKLGRDLGIPKAFEGSKDIPRRNTTLLAIAPTKSSAFVMGQVSESTEPLQANIFIEDKQKIKHTYKNPYLKKILAEKGKDIQEIWDRIAKDRGSVQKLDFLSDHEKEVFKTFSEISQMEVIIQASQRQKYIDQGQSVNLMIHPKTPARDINNLYIEAWRLGLKSLYYQKSINAAQEFSRSLIECSACEA